MTSQRTLEGGGRLTMEEGGGRVRFYATRPRDDRGLYKVWIWGGGGRMLLGTMTPQEGSLQLSRTLSRTALQSAGCYPVAGGEAVMAFAFQKSGTSSPRSQLPTGWEWAEEISDLFQDEILRQGRYSKFFMKKQAGEGFLLAIRFDEKKEFPILPIFCFCRMEKLESKIYLLWKFDASGRPIGWNIS